MKNRRTSKQTDIFDLIFIEKMNEIKEKIIKRYQDYGAKIKIKDCLYYDNDTFKFELKLLEKTRILDLKKYQKEVRIYAELQRLEIIEEGTAIWLIVSENKEKPKANLIPFLAAPEYIEKAHEVKLVHPIGIDVHGKLVVEDLTLYPHCVFCGTSGSGKSMAIIILLISLLAGYSPAVLNLIICDQTCDLLPFNNSPHLACPIITDFTRFYYALQALVREMERRIKLNEEHTEEFERLPYIVFVVDEFASFMSGSEKEKKETCQLIEKILRRGRHARIHAVLVAFNPTKNNLKLDVSDLPTKFVFRVASLTNSVFILGEGGAEKLSGNGEMLFKSSQSQEIKKIQGLYIELEPLKDIVNYIRDEWNKRSYDLDNVFRIPPNAITEPIITYKCSKSSQIKPKLLADIIAMSIQCPSISVNQLKEIFHIGWPKANKIMNMLESLGVVEELEAKLPRQVCSEVPEKALDFLRNNGYSDEQINEVLQKRPTNRIE